MIRLIILALFFLFSLLTIVRPPAYLLWIVSILVSEFSWVFAGITLFIVVSGCWVESYRLVGTVTGVAAFLLFLSPIARAYIAGRRVDQDFDAAWGIKEEPGEDIKPRPFSFRNLFAGLNEKEILYQTFTYSTHAGIPLTLDFYPSSTEGKRPCIIVVHGGSWSSGNSRELPELNSILAGSGYHVASINYRLAPGCKCPLPVEDVREAFAYLKKHCGQLGIDTSSFVLLGRSAGGQIALLAAYTLQEPGLRGVIGFYAPADMVWGYSLPANPWIMDSRKVMRDYLGGSYEECPEKYVASSPLEAASNRSVPTLLIHGRQDVLVAYEHSIRLRSKLVKDGVKCFLLSLPWATHGFDYNIHGPGGQLSTYIVKRFLHEITR